MSDLFCDVTGKVKHKKARQAANPKKGGKQKVSLVAYKCEHCGYFHSTSRNLFMNKRDRNRLVKNRMK